jgi:hypothetical protein
VVDRTPLKSGVGIPDINKKFEPHTGYQINLLSRATGKKMFTSIEKTFFYIVAFKRTTKKIFK